MTFLATSPCLKTISVGIERTSYFAVVCWFSSVLSLTTFRSSRSPAISSRTGATTRQGPHHGAQKSTRTGVSASMTSATKVVSVTSMTSAMFVSFPSAAVRCPSGTIQSVVLLSATPSDVADRQYGDPSGGQRPEQVRRDVHLDEGAGDQHRDGDAHRHERGREELVPVVAPRGDDPGSEREEQDGQLRQSVREEANEEQARRDAELGRERRRAGAEHEGLREQREGRGAHDEADGERPRLVVDPAPDAGVPGRLERQRGSSDEAGHARHGVQCEHERGAEP